MEQIEQIIGKRTSLAARSTFVRVNAGGQSRIAKPLWMRMSFEASAMDAGEREYIRIANGERRIVSRQQQSRMM